MGNEKNMIHHTYSKKRGYSWRRWGKNVNLFCAVTNIFRFCQKIVPVFCTTRYNPLQVHILAKNCSPIAKTKFHYFHGTFFLRDKYFLIALSCTKKVFFTLFGKCSKLIPVCSIHETSTQYSVIWVTIEI